MTGLEALAFVRERHAFASGDNQRGRNQMAMLQALIKKVCSIEFLENYNEVMDELTDMYRTNIPDELLKDNNQYQYHTAFQVFQPNSQHHIVQHA